MTAEEAEAAYGTILRVDAGGPPRRPMEERLKSLTNLLHDGIITEAQVAEALREMLDLYVPQQPVPVEMRNLICGTCRRMFCQVRTAKDTWVEPVCWGCIREGRAL